MSKSPAMQPLSCWGIAAQLSVEQLLVRREFRSCRAVEPKHRFVALCKTVQNLFSRMDQYARLEWYAHKEASFLSIELDAQRCFFKPLHKMLHGEMKRIIAEAVRTYDSTEVQRLRVEWMVYWKEHMSLSYRYVPQAQELFLWGEMVLQNGLDQKNTV